jgi:hypothetical protein
MAIMQGEAVSGSRVLAGPFREEAAASKARHTCWDSQQGLMTVDARSEEKGRGVATFVLLHLLPPSSLPVPCA